MMRSALPLVCGRSGRVKRWVRRCGVTTVAVNAMPDARNAPQFLHVEVQQGARLRVLVAHERKIHRVSAPRFHRAVTHGVRRTRCPIHSPIPIHDLREHALGIRRSTHAAEPET